MIEEPFIVKEGAGTSPAGEGLPTLPSGVEKDSQPVIPDVLPILPLREMVVFPGTVVPVSIRRDSSRKLLDASLAESKTIGFVTQRDATKEDPAPADLFSVGTAVVVLKLLQRSRRCAKMR
jgi:ATP-dependent Lon protease